MKRSAIVAIAGALLISFGIWWFSPTQVVKRRTLGLLETASLDAGSGRGVRQMAVYSMNGYLGSQVELDIPSVERANGSFDKSSLELGFSGLVNQAKQTKFAMREIRDISVEGGIGKVVLVVDAVVELPTYRPVDGIYEVTFEWKKGDDGWRLTRAKWVENP